MPEEKIEVSPTPTAASPNEQLGLIEEQLAAASVQVQQLLFERKQLHQEMDSAKAYLDTFSEHLSNVCGDLDRAVAENDVLVGDIDQARAYCSRLETELELIKSKKDKLQQENESLREENERLKHESFPVLIKSFQEAFRHYVPTNGNLYNPSEMESFCEENSPGLFCQIEMAITSDYSSTHDSDRRASLRRTRVVGELHRSAYLENQLNTTFMNDVGLHLSLSGCLEAALECGRRLGICTHPKTIREFRQKLATENTTLTNDCLEDATSKNQLAVLVVDDFHSIHTIQRPTLSETSRELHFATAIIDVHETIPSLNLQEGASIHYQPSENFVGRGIAKRRLTEYFTERLSSLMGSSLLISLPSSFQQLNVKDIQSCLENQRCYATPNHRDLDSLKSCCLLDESEQGLKSLADYKAVIEKALDCYPALRRYLSKYLLPSVGDYPTFYFLKKLVAQSRCEQSPILSLVPMLGPFHIYMNSMENLFTLYYPVFSDLYIYLFGEKKKLPRKPQFHRMTTILAALFGGWLMIREDVLCLFGVCKDIEFLALRHLLDELTPLVFYFYATIHRGSRYELWQESILRMAVVFIVQQRHNYNKAMLSVIGDHTKLWHLGGKILFRRT